MKAKSSAVVPSGNKLGVFEIIQMKPTNCLTRILK